MPMLQVVVASKFDNRLKEFAERWEVDRYLSATGYLHPNAKPFFVALPKVECMSIIVCNVHQMQSIVYSQQHAGLHGRLTIFCRTVA